MKITGIFELNIRDLNGNIIESYHDKNLVVDVGREVICDLLGGALTGKKIDKIHFGSNGTDATVADTFATLDQTDPNLDTPSANVTATYPTTTSVKYTWTMSTAQNNGAFLREYALIVDDATLQILFSRKVRDVIEKNNTQTLDGNWTINFE
jgi:hypothetical protein